MARAARIALDIALVSLRSIQPAVASLWVATKSAIHNTAAKPIVDNKVVCKVESSLGTLTEILTRKLIALRNQQFPGEIKYLEKELEKVRKKMGNQGNTSSKTLKPKIATAWQYAKTEMVPPLTLAFFHGPVGKKIEDTVSQVTGTLIDGLQKRIRDIDAEEQRKIKEKEDAIKAAIEKKKAEVKRKAEEMEKQKVKERAEKDKKDEAKAEKPKEPPKDEKKKAPVSKKDMKKKKR